MKARAPLVAVAVVASVAFVSTAPGAGAHPLAAIAGSHVAALPPSAVQGIGGAVSVFPAPGTQTASPASEISIRGISPKRIGAIVVRGSVSGLHKGSFAAHRDGRGASFVPARPFAPGERVTVTTHLRIIDATRGTFRFTVAQPEPEPPLAPTPPAPPASPVVLTFASAPELHATPVNVTHPAGATAPGLVLLGPKRGAGTDSAEIVDNSGQPVWIAQMDKGVQANDVRVQTYHGQPVLTWWEGQAFLGHGNGIGVVEDEHYQRVATFHAGNGYDADLHEFELTARGTALLTIYRVVRWNLTPVGGPVDGLALDSIVQEVEEGTGHVLFEWHALGSVPLTDSFAPKPDPGQTYDFFHVNSATSDGSGHVLVSGRGVHTIYQLDGKTARVVWRLGGKHSTYTMGPGAAFNSQHDAKWLGPNKLSVFDNGSGVGAYDATRSRGIVLSLDPKAHTASLVSEYPQPLGKLFRSQGDIEPLPNGDMFVGWGEGPFATEFDSAGNVVFELQFASGQSYRAYRYPWRGTPTTPPSLAVRDGVAYASWNGATEVAAWQLLAGASADALEPLPPAPRTGFESSLALPAGAAGVAVRALAADGSALGVSAAVPVTSG